MKKLKQYKVNGNLNLSTVVLEFNNNNNKLNIFYNYRSLIIQCCVKYCHQQTQVISIKYLSKFPISSNILYANYHLKKDANKFAQPRIICILIIIIIVIIIITTK